MLKMRQLLISFFLIQISSTYALEIKHIGDNQTITAKISSTDVTRIFVKDDRISSVRGIKGAYTHENDEKNGEVYIQPTSEYQFRAFTILIDTEEGRHFTLLLTPVGSPSEALMLVPKGHSKDKVQRLETVSNYEFSIFEFIKNMRNHNMHNGYAPCVNKNEKYNFNNKVLAQLHGVYKSQNYSGEIFTLTNVYDKPIRINEKIFYKPNTNAISLDSLVLRPKQSTYLYRVISYVR